MEVEDTYNCFSSYIAAKDKASWAQAHPAGWKIVSKIEYDRWMKIKEENPDA